MKLDYDLIRDILLYVEEQADGHTNYLWENLYNKFPGETPDKLQYHKKYLIDSGMIDGNSRAFIDLTPYGHE